MVNNLFNGTATQKALAQKTIKNAHGVLHKALKQALLLGYIKSNPADVCKLPRITKGEVETIDDTKVGAFLAGISGHRYEILYKLTLFSGLRQSEVIGLKWSYIDIQEGM